MPSRNAAQNNPDASLVDLNPCLKGYDADTGKPRPSVPVKPESRIFSVFHLDARFTIEKHFLPATAEFAVLGGEDFDSGVNPDSNGL